MSSQQISLGGNIAQALHSPELNELEKKLRQQFVTEYLKDHSEVNAAVRCGYLRSVAVEYGMRLMQEPYVQQLIADATTAQPEDPYDEEELNKRRILNSLFREADDRTEGASHSARVSALSKLASIHGMEAPTKIDANVNHRGGVMMVPAVVDLDTWEQEAVASQEKLVHDTRNGE